MSPYQERWPKVFQAFAQSLRLALGDTALAIHHIGSTSVLGLAAKDIIDIQVTVNNLDIPIHERLEPLKLINRTDIASDHCPPGMVLSEVDLRKKYFQNAMPRINIHIRERGRFNQRYALLCRDYLRSHSMAAAAYGEIKRQLARYFPDNVEAYYDIKDPVFDVLMSGAFDWAKMTAWQEPPTDA